MDAYTLRNATNIARSQYGLIGRSLCEQKESTKRPFNLRAIYLFTAILLFSMTNVNAATKSWVPTAGGPWTTAANWSPSGVPATGDDVTISADQSAAITAVPSITLASLTINGSCSLSAATNGNTITVTNSLTVASSKTVTLTNISNRREWITIETSATGTINGRITASGASTVRNNGIVILSPAGLIDGAGTFVNAAGATMKIGSPQGIVALGTAAGNIQMTVARTYTAGGKYEYNGTAAQVTGTGLTTTNAADLTINNTAGAVTLSAATTLTGTLTVKAGSTLANGGFALTAPAIVTECGATSGPTISGAGTLTLTGPITVNSVGSGSSGATISCPIATTAVRTCTVANDGTSAIDLTINSIISGTAGGILKNGAGTMLLGGANSYTGATTVSAGTLKINNASALGTNASGTTVSTNGSLDLNGIGLTTADALTLNGTGVSSEGALQNTSATAATYNGALTLGSASSIGTIGNISITGGITGGGFDLTKVGAGTLSLGTGAVSLGATSVSAGTLTSTSNTLSLTGSFTNNGTFTHNGGTVTFNGTSGTQTIGGSSQTTFNVVTMSGASTKQIDNNIVINSTLTNSSILNVSAKKSLTVGGNITNDGTLTLKCGTTGGPATLVNSGTISGTGTCNMEQYLEGFGDATTPTGRGWYVSSPVSNAPRSMFTDNANGHGCWQWDEAGQAYSNPAGNLAPKKGYVFRDGVTSTKTFTGSSFNTGTQDITGLTYTGSSAKRGYNLVGNPYPSYLDFHALTKNNVMATIWYCETASKTTPVMRFATYNAAGPDSTFDATRSIPPMQSVWVKVLSNAGGSLGVPNSARVHNRTGFLRSATKASDRTLLRLNVSNGTIEDQTVISFNTDASSDLDPYDSEKMSNNNVSIPEISTMVNGIALAINGMNSVENAKVLPIKFYTGAAGTFSINAMEMNNFDSNVRIILTDNLLNVQQNLVENPIYSFTSGITNSSDRFTLTFANIPTKLDRVVSAERFAVWTNSDGSVQVQLIDLDSQATRINIYSVSGQHMFTQRAEGVTTTIQKVLPQGFYVVEIQKDGYKGMKKIVINQ